MSLGTLTDQEVLKQIVRGERPVSDLTTIGMSLTREESVSSGTAWSVKNPKGVELTADARDIAKGILAHLSDPSQLREWAFLIHASNIELTVEDHPASDTILQALWDASFGEPIDAEVQALLEEIANQNETGA